MRRSLLTVLAVLFALLAVACADAIETEPKPTREGTPNSADILATRTFPVPAANSFDEPGFHHSLVISATVPSDIGPTSGRRFVLTLRDSSRPDQTCSRQHPLSGCVTVDWSDDPSRPNVPTDGVFDNHLVLPIDNTQSMFFLHEDGQLTTEPESFDPG